GRHSRPRRPSSLLGPSSNRCGSSCSWFAPTIVPTVAQGHARFPLALCVAGSLSLSRMLSLSGGRSLWPYVFDRGTQRRVILDHRVRQSAVFTLVTGLFTGTRARHEGRSQAYIPWHH